MRVEIHRDSAAASVRAAGLIATLVRESVAQRGRCVVALSGGTEPWEAFRLLARHDLPWDKVHVLQVDERIAPAGDPERNYTHLRESLLERAPIPADNVHPMPVEDSDLGAAAARYAETLRALCGSPAQLDIVHLGLGQDGHTASLVPGDPVLEATQPVALTGVYRGHRRMTLTFPVLNAARVVVWLVVGDRKAEALARLLGGRSSEPAARVSAAQAILLADRAAARLSMPG